MSKAINTFLQDFLASLPPETDGVSRQQILDLWNSDETQTKLFEVCKSTKGSKVPKAPKEPKVPKRAKNAYVLYCQEYRTHAKDELPKDHKNSDVMSKLGQMWKDLCSSTKDEDIQLVSKYTEQAAAEKELFAKEHNVVAKEPKAPKKPKAPKEPKVPKAPKEPKRAKNAYVLYSQDHRALVKGEIGTSANNSDVVRELGKRWKALVASHEASDQEVVLKYTKLAELEKEQFVAKFPKPFKPIKKDPKYCYGCHTHGYGRCDNQGWFYCDECWGWYSWSGEEEEPPCQSHSADETVCSSQEVENKPTCPTGVTPELTHVDSTQTESVYEPSPCVTKNPDDSSPTGTNTLQEPENSEPENSEPVHRSSSSSSSSSSNSSNSSNRSEDESSVLEDGNEPQIPESIKDEFY